MAVDVPLHQVFDYLLPAGMATPAAGSRVVVPFGRRQLVGLVWPGDGGAHLPASRLKPVARALDETPFFAEDEMALLQFAARYYHHPAGEVMAAALPPLLRNADASQLRTEYWSLTVAGHDALTAALARKAPKQHELLSQLDAHPGGRASDALNTDIPGWRRVAGALLERGWVAREERALSVDWTRTNDGEPGPTLNTQQSDALAALTDSAEHFSVSLLDGVTGSGKTEVYLQRIRQCIASGKQALILVPEIGLTPQLAARFERRLGHPVALLHSELGDTQRTMNWIAAASGDAAIVLGTRSAVFTPLARPGLIIIDEEHDASLKQHEGFRYHARDLAVWRGQRHNIPVILGSATPSLESLQNARSGRYQHLRLTERAGDAIPPAIRVIDMNRFNAIEGISQPVLDAMRRHLEQGQQVLVYLNRRGFAPTLICTACGDMADCLNCDAHMTVHARRGQLQCHHCGARRALPTHCDNCKEPMKPLGEGTERVEQVLAAQFPDYPLARIDSDTTQARGSMDALMQSAKRGDTRILIGTQMLAKGHHLPGLTLVVILNADQGFFASDFRAPERLAQSVLQVAGRAGRADIAGEVLIQSAFAQHPLLRTLIESGYHAFADQALAERAAARWPPFSYVAVLHAASKDPQIAQAFLHRAKGAMAANGIDVLGPAPASMQKRAGRHRFQLLLQADSRKALQAQLDRLSHSVNEIKPSGDLRWSLDVDPQAEL